MQEGSFFTMSRARKIEMKGMAMGLVLLFFVLSSRASAGRIGEYLASASRRAKQPTSHGYCVSGHRGPQHILETASPETVRKRPVSGVPGWR